MVDFAQRRQVLEAKKRRLEQDLQDTLERERLVPPEEGTVITATEAATKYGIQRTSVYLWVRYGWVRKLEGGVDEHDLVMVLREHPGKGGPKPIVRRIPTEAA